MLYQLSYASPYHSKKEALTPETRADTLPLRT
jgi:hypothetical protein